MKNILITGGAGFIGSNLCRELLKEGHEVACLDDLSTGKLRNIESLNSGGILWIGANLYDDFDYKFQTYTVPRDFYDDYK